MRGFGDRYSQKDKNKAKIGQNRAWDWKERGKPKPKAYASYSKGVFKTAALSKESLSDLILSGSDLVVSFPSGNRNKTFNPGISIEVQSKRFLSLNKFSISFISDPLSLVLETLLPFSSEIEDKVFSPEILVIKEEKSPHLLSHRGFKAFKIIHNFLNEIPMMIYEGDIPIWDVPYLHFYPP
ncbi:hypothetical protein Tco_1067609 [Tanacetum coccineum]|uniref:Uncharacterized protein n=1 Tax=Tanacetum coccineum TaxID=301880 RepID=A0ABQ5HDE1_9ASTR